MKVLILTPNLKNLGGVSSLFNLLNLDDLNDIEYFCVQSERERTRRFRLYELILKYCKFIFVARKFDIVHLNPSYDKRSFYRDSVFLILSKLLRKKTLVYWHGWEMDFQNRTKDNKILSFYFKNTYRRSDFTIVLGSIFKKRLIEMGITPSKIVVESNAADDKYLIENELDTSKESRKIELLFISRIEKEKGIFIAIEAMQFLDKEKYHLIVAGHGHAINEAKVMARQNEINNITFIGKVDGKEKHNVFSSANILLFPTFYPEGMPICIIEAMLYGLVVVSRPIGGIPDWVKVPDNGILTNTLDAKVFASLIEDLCFDLEKIKKISAKNKEYSKTYFTPVAFKRRLFNYYSITLRE